MDTEEIRALDTLITLNGTESVRRTLRAGIDAIRALATLPDELRGLALTVGRIPLPDGMVWRIDSYGVAWFGGRTGKLEQRSETNWLARLTDPAVNRTGRTAQDAMSAILKEHARAQRR